MEPQDRRRLLFAAVAAAVATFVTAFVTAIALAVVDLYLTGHSRPSLMRPLLERPAIGVRLSAGDIILMLISLGAGAGAGTPALEARPMIRRMLLGAAVVAMVASPSAKQPASLATLDRDIQSGVHGHVDHLLVLRNGQVVFDKKYPRDYRAISRGQSGPLGCGDGCTDTSKLHQFNYLHPDWHPYFQDRPVHTLQSVTKSIAATAVGLALAGNTNALDRPFLDYFSDRDLSKVDPRLKRATVRDLLTMRSGIEWHETDRPLNETNTTYQLEYSQDWIGFTLSQPMDADPGTKWAYNSGGSHLMAGIVRSATGDHIDAYLQKLLFEPLGIKDFHWKKSPTGYPDSEGGLYLAAADLAKIGQLYLRDGVWNGRRILPEGWVKDATARHVKNVAPSWDYGYQWWITSHAGEDVWAGRGFGGQMLIVIPTRSIVAVVNSWNVFGNKARGIQGPLLDALLQAQ